MDVTTALPSGGVAPLARNTMSVDRPPTTILRAGPRLTTAWVLSAVVLAVMVLTSAIGLLAANLYPDCGATTS